MTIQAGNARVRAILTSCVDVTARFEASDLASDRNRESHILVIVNFARCLHKKTSRDDFSARDRLKLRLEGKFVANQVETPDDPSLL
jgi:hypothetical protein